MSDDCALYLFMFIFMFMCSYALIAERRLDPLIVYANPNKEARLCAVAFARNSEVSYSYSTRTRTGALKYCMYEYVEVEMRER